MSERAARLPVRRTVLAALTAASLGCVALVQLRLNGSEHYRFLDWNLFLAWVPLVLALGASLWSGQKRRWPSALLGMLWLVFFPNAPYLVSDFIHLHQVPGVPLWRDGLMFAAFAGTGLLLGFTSLYLMQRMWERAHGRLLSWLGVTGSLVLASIGLYLGRVLRFNSWDVVTYLLQLTRVMLLGLLTSLQHPGLLVLLAGLSGALLVGYVVVYGFSALRLDSDRE